MNESKLTVFYPTIYTIGFLMVIGFASFGFLAPLLYIFLMKIIFPVAVSMHISDLQQKGLAFSETQSDRWTIYLYGVPVKETKNTLVNVYFRGKGFLIKKLSLLVLIRSVISGMIFFLSIFEFIKACINANPSLLGVVSIVCGSISFTCLFVVFRYSARLFMTVKRGCWLVNEKEIKNTFLYSAYIPYGKGISNYMTYLDALFGGAVLYWRMGVKS